MCSSTIFGLVAWTKHATGRYSDLSSAPAYEGACCLPRRGRSLAQPSLVQQSSEGAEGGEMEGQAVRCERAEATVDGEVGKAQMSSAAIREHTLSWHDAAVDYPG
eukprot:CAMPEP_0174700226 /NCGR_PEP_ID=MMETSP1094-20130205/5247_1 /TAXON_ID=156173 /ORGANISM="Chrysochromulina brevifilum, Strain UTEX LB 985" /LENGTH=104 /DNA_ID=CAMNT_0015897669 /DNA_START=32 /DNA_END=347 /DNA_ORIENTATION=-